MLDEILRRRHLEPGRRRSGFKLGDVEEFLEQSLEPFEIVVLRVDDLLLPFAEIACRSLAQQLVGEQQRSDRRAQLMGGYADKLRLELIELFEVCDVLEYGDTS